MCYNINNESEVTHSMIKFKMGRNASDLPDNYNELDHDMIFLMYKDQFSQFFIDLLQIFPERMNQLISDYFNFINYNTPIDARTVSIGINKENDSVAVPYHFVKDAVGDYITLEEQTAQAINDWFDTFYSAETAHRLTDCLSTNICKFYNDVLNEVERPKYDDFMRTLANRLDMHIDDFMDDIIDACEQSDGSNLWTDTTYKFNDTEDAIKGYLLNAYTIEELWMACIYTRQYTNFEPDNA